ncbi:hypothetical protein P8452_12721 [Trifolium repens]|nr:hypothetical protein P8452_12721 [Trifolium repens]
MVYNEKEKVDSKYEVSYMQLMCLIKCSHGFLSTLTSWVIQWLTRMRSTQERCIINEYLLSMDLRQQILKKDVLYAESRCPFSTPSKSMEFVNDLIVTPPMSRGKDDIESNVPAAVKRNLSKESLSLLDLPESVSSFDLESQMNWLIDSFSKAHNDIYVLQEEISTIKEASINYIDRLSISLLVESQEKDYLQSELTDLRFEYEEFVGKNHQNSLEKDQIVKMLVDFSGLNMENEGIDQFSSNTPMIIDLCFQKMKGQNGNLSKASHIDPELFERVQSILYVRDQSLKLYEDILEEDMLIRSDVSNELKVVSDEVIALKDERSSLLKDLERSEEKTSMLRDKLSMAIKKGKGLVQDRDNLKGLINEKNSEIERLKVVLQKQESAVSEYKDESIDCPVTWKTFQS